jgi:thiamine pyrophosphate-dependent acetolactate synthase large subunit-like protein
MGELARIMGEIVGRPRGADFVIDSLRAAGTEVLFTLPAESINSIVDASRRQNQPRLITVRHEGAGSLMASAYAKLTGRVGVCMATNGPGATHLTVGCLDAKRDHAPLLAITGHVPSAARGTGAFQEIDSPSLFGEVTSVSTGLWGAENLPRLVSLIAEAGKARSSVHVAIPSSVVVSGYARATNAQQDHVNPGSWRSSDTQLAEAVGRLGSRSAAILVGASGGGGALLEALSSPHGERLLAFPESIQSPGWDAVPRDHRLISSAAFDNGRIGAADAAVLIGDWPSAHERFLDSIPLILHATERPSGKPESTRYTNIVGRLTELLAAVRVSEPVEAVQQTPGRSAGGTEQWFRRFDDELPPDAVVAVEPSLVSAAFGGLTSRSRTFTSSFGARLTGYAIPAAIAGAVAFPGRRAVAIVDEEGLREGLAELLTARKHELPMGVVLIRAATAAGRHFASLRKLATSVGFAFESFSEADGIGAFLSGSDYGMAVVELPSCEESAPNTCEELLRGISAAARDLDRAVIASPSMRAAAGWPSDGSVAPLVASYAESAAMMAAGLAKTGDRSAICVVASEAEFLRQLNGLHDAVLDGSPMVVVSIEDGWGIDSARLVENIVVQTIDSPIDVSAAVSDALAIADNALAPVHVRIGRRTTAGRTLPRNRSRTAAVARPATETLEAISDLLRRARRPVILAGGGAVSASSDVIEFARVARIPIVATMGSRGRFDHAETFVGYLGSSGHFTADRTVARSDLVLVLGVSNRGHAYELRNDGVKTIAINLDHEALARTPAGHLAVCASIESVIPGLAVPAAQVGKGRDRTRVWADRYLRWHDRSGKNQTLRGRIRPSFLFRMLDTATRARPGMRICADVGVNTLWLYRYMSRHAAITWTRNFATMGFAMPSALAQAWADPSTPVLAVAGDGGFAMTMPEMLTAVDLDVPIVVVIVDNGALSAIRYEEEIMGWPEAGSSLWNGDFALFAEACGARGVRVAHASALEPALREALESGRPCVVNVVCSPDEPPVPARRPQLVKRLALIVSWAKQGRRGVRSALATIPGLWTR